MDLSTSCSFHVSWSISLTLSSLLALLICWKILVALLLFGPSRCLSGCHLRGPQGAEGLWKAWSFMVLLSHQRKQCETSSFSWSSLVTTKKTLGFDKVEENLHISMLLTYQPSVPVASSARLFVSLCLLAIQRLQIHDHEKISNHFDLVNDIERPSAQCLGSQTAEPAAGNVFEPWSSALVICGPSLFPLGQLTTPLSDENQKTTVCFSNIILPEVFGRMEPVRPGSTSTSNIWQLQKIEINKKRQ